MPVITERCCSACEFTARLLAFLFGMSTVSSLFLTYATWFLLMDIIHMAWSATQTNMEVITGQSKKYARCLFADIQHEEYNVHSYYEDARKQQDESPVSFKKKKHDV